MIKPLLLSLLGMVTTTAHLQATEVMAAAASNVIKPIIT